LNGDLVSSSGYIGTELFTGVIDGNVGNARLGIAAWGTSPSQHYVSSSAITVHAGDYIDFFVDKYNGSLTNDLTVVHATISEVPEPATIVMLASGLIGLLAYAWRKRK
jgi:threonine dehydrogenase-like Zn-dependent dehydrogenase